MRVIHVITRLIVGGAQENTVSTVLGLLQKKNTQVTLLSGPTTGPEGTLESGFAAHANVLRIVPPLIRAVHPWHDVMATVSLMKIFRREKPDIVHTHSGKAGILGRLAASRTGVPIVIHTIHGPSFGSFQGPLPNWIFRQAERRACPWTTHYISVADAMTRQYLAAGIGTPAQYTRIFSGFRLEPYVAAKNDLRLREQLGFKPSDVIISKIARLFPLKGHEDLLHIAPALIKTLPNIRFLLIGDGILHEQIQGQINQQGLNKYFVFTGLIPPTDIPKYLGITDLLVHLSKREGLARALSQTLATGHPVISYDCDGASEVCIPNETGCLIPPGDTESLKSAITQLVQSPALRSSLGKKGQALVQSQFSEEKMVDDIFTLYQNLHQKHVAPAHL